MPITDIPDVVAAIQGASGANYTTVNDSACRHSVYVLAVVF